MKTAFTALPSVDPSHCSSSQCLAVTQTFLSLINIKDPVEFTRRIQEAIDSLVREPEDIYQSFCTKLREKLPKRQLTLKGRDRLKLAVFQRLRRFYLDFRAALEAESTWFYRNYWLLFYQPEHLTEERTRRLNAFLTKYPALQEYRDMTLLVGEIYRKDASEIDGHQIDDLVIRSYHSHKLQAAIYTLKKHKNSILRFVKVFQEDPSLGKACRANMEYYNRRFKAPFQKGLSCTKQEHLLSKLQLQLGCEIRFFLDEKAVD